MIVDFVPFVDFVRNANFHRQIIANDRFLTKSTKKSQRPQR